jgi:hypothetical protein
VQRFAMIASAAFLAGIAIGSPAQAQDEAGSERINQLIVYGNDPCPQSSNETEITVCARKAESERYRIPENLRGIDSPQSSSWNSKVLAYETVGKQGTLSCSPVGPGGSTGCLGKLIEKAYAEKGMDGQLKFSELIAAEREKRLSTIDAEAADTQGRVEQAERDYEARQRAQQEASQAPAPAGQ